MCLAQDPRDLQRTSGGISREFDETSFYSYPDGREGVLRDEAHYI